MRVPVTIESFIESYADTVNTQMCRDDVLRSLSRADALLTNAYKNREEVFVFGNGGSAAVADHFMCDHVKLIHENDRSSLKPRVRSLCADTPLMTAIANDSLYEDVFSSQLIYNFDKPGVVVAMSVSGNSGNVLRGLQTASRLGHRTIALVGKNGGIVKSHNLASCTVHFQSDNYGVVEDCFSVAMHCLAQWVSTSC